MKKSQLRLRELRNQLRRFNADRARQEMPVIPEVEEMYLRIQSGEGDQQALIAEAEAVLGRARG